MRVGPKPNTLMVSLEDARIGDFLAPTLTSTSVILKITADAVLYCCDGCDPLLYTKYNYGSVWADKTLIKVNVDFTITERL